MDSRVKGTYLHGTADEPQFLQSGRSCDWRFPAHNPEKGLPRRSGFCFSPPMTKANQTPPGSENPVRVLGSYGPAQGMKTIFPPSTSSRECTTGSCNHVLTQTALLCSSPCCWSVGRTLPALCWWQTELGYTLPFTLTRLRKKGGLETPGALSPMAVKELRLMINLSHTLPLPDLSKQGRAEERKAEGGEKEMRSRSVTQTKLQLYNWYRSSCTKAAPRAGGTGKALTAGFPDAKGLLVLARPQALQSPVLPCCAPAAPSSQPPQREGFPFASLPAAAPGPTHQQPQLPETLLKWEIAPG